jgi:enterochelin esterase-like enzyme
MELTGPGVLAVTVLLALTTPATALLLWSRVRGAAVLRVVQRLSLVLACQLTAVLLTAVLVNDQFSLYESWADLLGTDQAQAGQPQPDPNETSGSTLGAARALQGAVAPLPGLGRLRHETLHGPRSGVTAKVWVLLPDGYDTPAAATRRYPVVVFLPGYPGTPTTWLHALELQKVLDAEVSAGRVPPLIAVLPTMNVAAPRDTECTDVPGGPQVATWLGTDVPQLVHAQTRSLPPGAGWAVTGYSTGGFCAAKLVLTAPQSFGSGAVLAGYFTASTDVTTGDLFGGSEQARRLNDPLWLVSNRPAPPSNLLTVWSAQDPETAGPTQAFLKAVKPPLKVEEIRLARGGHNTQVWLGALPAVLSWLGAHLHG